MHHGLILHWFQFCSNKYVFIGKIIRLSMFIITVCEGTARGESIIIKYSFYPDFDAVHDLLKGVGHDFLDLVVGLVKVH